MIHEYQFSIDSIDAANKATHTTYAEDSICNGLAKGRRMESNGKRVLGAYFIADRFSNGFVQDVSRLVEPINRNRTDRFEIRVCDTNTPLVLAVPAVSTQAAPVNINVGITIKKTR